jgi:DNA-directed RNA polymerase specialized sigma24 family protein
MDPGWVAQYVAAWKRVDASLASEPAYNAALWKNDLGREALRDAALGDFDHNGPLDDALRLLLQPSGLMGLAPQDAGVAAKIRRLLAQKMNERLKAFRVEWQRTHGRPPRSYARSWSDESANAGSLRTSTEPVDPASFDPYSRSNVGPALSDVENKVLRAQIKREIAIALKGLPDDEAKAVRLHFGIDGPRLTQAALGKALGKRKDSAQALVQSGLQRLKENDTAFRMLERLHEAAR